MPALNNPSNNRPDNPSGQGDLYATIKVILPTALSREEQELFQRLKDIRNSERENAGSDG